MVRTLNLGPRHDYQRRELWSIMAASFVQSLKMIKGGRLLKGGGYHQVGGEFVFQREDIDINTPIQDLDKQLGDQEEEKVVVWCHRMKNTRDHAEVPELREVLGLDDAQNLGGRDGEGKRWKRALLVRKGTGLAIDGRTSLAVNRKVAEFDVGNRNELVRSR